MSDFSRARQTMVDRHIKPRGIDDPQVLAALLKVPRHLFVEDALRGQAYGDYALPIGDKQTISQPYIVALMTAALQLKKDDRVLEIGTGSGYQTAVLAQLVSRIFSIERLPLLARRARKILDSIGCAHVQIRVGDGTLGWPEEAPFDAIIVTAGAPKMVEVYCRQLAPGGRLVIPVGGAGGQQLRRITRTTGEEYREEDLVDCRFVPLIGSGGWPESPP
jgi:protein-L-isoaspartate(D-aspartate) O-methyltransferase